MTNWKKVWMGALLLLFVASVSAIAQARPHRVVFALVSRNEGDWSLTIDNIRNLLTGLAPEEAEIEVVAYGPGIGFVAKGSSAAPAIAELTAKHVRFVACQNAMRTHKLTTEDLLPNIDQVPAGIVEVVKKQEQGWTYIKAGQ